MQRKDLNPRLQACRDRLNRAIPPQPGKTRIGQDQRWDRALYCTETAADHYVGGFLDSAEKLLSEAEAALGRVEAGPLA
jgi:hypothetical protein